MTSPLVRRPTRAKKLIRIAALAGCAVVGFGVALGVSWAVSKPPPPAEAEHDDHATDEHVEPPNTQRLDVAVKSGNYAVGLKLARGLLGEGHGGHDEHDEHPPTPADPHVKYALALCLEGLERWADAIEAYEALGAEDAPGGVKAVAACGLVRCHLAEGEVTEATGALVHAERFAAGVPGLQTELDYLRGRLALHTLAPPKPGPFAPDHPMGVPPNLPPAEYLAWLPLPTSAAGDPAAPPATTSAAEPAKAVLAAFNAVVAADPPHPDEPAVRLTVANVRFAAGELVEAAREYKRVRESHPPEPVMVAATYNLGLIRHRDREWAVARQLFSDAADLGAHTPAAAVAWWWVGRTELDAGNVDACAAAWNRADESPDREITAAALLGRVFLKLLAGEPERAERFFHGQRLANVDPIPALGEVFHGYFRFAARPTDLNRSELVTAIRHADHGKLFGPAGQLVFGGWLGEAGEGKEMLAVYDAASETARGVWAVRIALGAGEHLYASGNRTAAKGRFTVAAATDAGEYGDRARVRLAEIALTAGRADECVAYCRSVLKRDHTDRTDVLRLLGRGYEQLNRPRAAAECFAGRLPTQ